MAALAARSTREADTAQARHDYTLAREEARESLQIERASQNAAQALQQQQHLENGDEWIEEEEGHGYWMPADGEGGSTPVDRYANVEINLPTALGQVHSSDPQSADIGHAGNPFDASFNMGNAFGSALVQSGDGEGPMDPYSLANQATSPRGGQFDLDNPLAAAGNTQAQAEQTINNPWGPNNRLLDVNWLGDVRNEPTNAIPGSQVRSGNTTGNNVEIEFGQNDIPIPGSPVGNEYSMGGEDGDTPGVPSPNPPGHLPTPSNTENALDLNSLPDKSLDEIEKQLNGGHLSHEAEQLLKEKLQKNYSKQSSIKKNIDRITSRIASLEGSFFDIFGYGKKELENLYSELNYFQRLLANAEQEERQLREQLNNKGAFKWQAGDHVAEMSLQEKLQAAFEIAWEKGYFAQALQGLAESLTDPDTLKQILFEAFIELGTKAVAIGTGVGAVAIGGFIIRDGIQIGLQAYEVILEVNDAYTQSMLDAAAKNLANASAGLALQLLGPAAAKGTQKAGAAGINAASNIARKTPAPKRIAGSVDLPDTKHTGPTGQPPALPDNLHANAGGNPAGNALNGLKDAQSPKNLPPAYKKKKGGDQPDVKEFNSLDELNAAVKKPLPNTTYKHGNYSWTTDSQGRVTSAEGVISKGGGNRSSLQTQIGKEGYSTDVGFHLIADIFDGPTNRLNVVSGNGRRLPNSGPNLNQGPWKSIENKISRLVDAGHKVEVKIEAIYNAGNMTNRPDSFVYNYRIDGGAWNGFEFPNYQ